MQHLNPSPVRGTTAPLSASDPRPPHAAAPVPPFVRWLDRYIEPNLRGRAEDERMRARVLAAGTTVGAVAMVFTVIGRLGDTVLQQAIGWWGLTGFLLGLVVMRAGAAALLVLDVTLLWHTAGLTVDALVRGPAHAASFAAIGLVPLVWVWGRGTRAGLGALAWTLGVLAVVAALEPPTAEQATGLLGLASATCVGWVIATVYDSERHRRLVELEGARKRLELAVEAGRLGTIEWSQEERRLTLSPRACRLLGLPADVVATWPMVLAAVVPDDRAGVEALPGAARRAGGRASAEARVVRPDGSTRWLAVDLLVDPGGVDQTINVALHDITAHRREAELREEFLGNVSHELRSPLTALTGALSLLEAEEAGTPQGRRYVELARNNAARVLRLVDDLLELQRSESGAVHVELASTDVAEVLRGVVDGVGPGGAPVLLEAEPCPRIQTDAHRLAQVVTNLVSNAVRLSPPDRPVRVRCVSRAGGGVRVEVIDRGPGIPDEFRPKLFQRFAQVRAGKGSSGLGLAISQALVRRLGGRIGVDSAVGEGSTFWVELPLVVPSAADVSIG